MDAKKKQGRYDRIYKQLEQLMPTCSNPESRMNTIIAVLHHKMDYYFWTGFYFLNQGELQVKMYQGPVACMQLAKDTGVCWEGVNTRKPVLVKNVEEFPGHIACDGRSKSELVVPLFDPEDNLLGVLDIDSDQLNAFDEVDEQNLVKILQLIWS
ncbi:Free methionine-R-sulfoxide reductase [Salinivirga cyanobacteriivorans]|uniref:Free methionine-R-sulfoxide reductase n=1 Tax=Salinivirga cyanobacteriivorans TaxID=1307839 RepID=A0A0S2I0P3_9BACT|nr:GAF domain-containing protein [Salinivirga cyanobacteriivorans]ALO15914.1 Free methionine-R-sulfoxide reductase [Salinivirga cyanobacteriivorans]